MATKRECVVLALDVGPRMHPYLDEVKRAAADFVTQKIVHRPRDDVCLLLFGTSGTRNRENDKSAAELGGEDDYAHITEAHDLGPPTGEYIKTLHTLEPGRGRSDLKEALAVAAAVLVGDRAQGAAKRIVLLSNLCWPAQDDPDDELSACLAEGMQQQEIALDVLHLDAPGDDQLHERDKVANLNQLAAICQELSHRERHFRSAPALLSAFQAHEVAARATATGVLEIGSRLRIAVKVSGKTMKEKFPPAGRETAGTAIVPEGVALAESLGAGVKQDRIWYYADTEAHGEAPVPAAEVGAAYRYGANLVPVEEGQRPQFKFPTQKGIRLLGFLDWDAVPRHFYMHDVKVMVADKAREASCLALAALVTAMDRQHQKAVLRWVGRDGQPPVLMLASPVPGGAAAAPHLLLNSLPFMEDMREYRFPSFTKKAWEPSEEQLDAAAALVKALDLGSGDAEHLRPERTADPALHRLYWECGRRVVDPSVPLQDEDALAAEVLEPHPERHPGAEEALEAARAAFPMNEEAQARRRAAARVGTQTPREDYGRLVEEEGGPSRLALEALAEATLELLKAHSSSRNETAVELVDVLRGDCAAADQPDLFNNFLQRVERRCRDDPGKCEFWRRLCRREVTLLSSEEAPASQLDAAAAREWYAQHRMQ